LGRVKLGLLKYCIDPQNTQAADSQNRYDHRREGRTHAPQSACDHINHTQQEIGQADEAHTDDAVGNSLRGVRNVDRKQLGRKPIHKGSQRDSNHRYTAKTDPKRLTDAFILMRAVVLAYKVHRGLGEGIDTNIDKALDILGGCIARHENIAEGIDGGLDQNVGNIEQRALNTRRQTDLDYFEKLSLIKPHFGSSSLQASVRRMRMITMDTAEIP